NHYTTLFRSSHLIQHCRKTKVQSGCESLDEEILFLVITVLQGTDLLILDALVLLSRFPLYFEIKYLNYYAQLVDIQLGFLIFYFLSIKLPIFLAFHKKTC